MRACVRACVYGNVLERRRRGEGEKGGGKERGKKQTIYYLDLLIGSRDNNGCVVYAGVLAIGLQHHQAEDTGHQDRNDKSRHCNTHQDWGAEIFSLLFHPEHVT